MAEQRDLNLQNLISSISCPYSEEQAKIDEETLKNHPILAPLFASIIDESDKDAIQWPIKLVEGK